MPYVGNKRNRNNNSRSVRHKEVEPLQNQIDGELIQKLCNGNPLEALGVVEKMVLRSWDDRSLSYATSTIQKITKTLYELCEENHSLNTVVVDWSGQLLKRYSDSIPLESFSNYSIKNMILKRTRDDKMSSFVLLWTSCLYSYQQYQPEEYKKVLEKIIRDNVDKQSKDTWIVSWLSKHFPTFCIPLLLQMFEENESSLLPENIEIMTLTAHQLEEDAKRKNLLGLTKTLEFLSSNISHHFKTFLKQHIYHAPFRLLLRVLLYCPGVIRNCSAILLCCFDRMIDDDKQNTFLGHVIHLLPLHISSFGFDILQLVRCTHRLPLSWFSKYNENLISIFGMLVEQSNPPSLFVSSFRQHLADLHAAIIPFCTMVCAQGEKEISDEVYENIIKYLQMISVTCHDESVPLEILFRLFILENNECLPLFQEFSGNIIPFYPTVLTKFVQRVVTFIGRCNPVDLVRSLNSLHFLFQIGKKKSSLSPLHQLLDGFGSKENYERISSLLCHFDDSVKVRAFRILVEITPLVTCPISSFVLVQRLLSTLLEGLAAKEAKCLDALPCFDVDWKISHIVMLLLKNAKIALQALDFFLDFPFSSRATGILRIDNLGMIPPSNYLVAPEPVMAASFFTFQTNSPLTQHDGLLHQNKSRKLFGKDMQQDKVIPPPVNMSMEELERNRRRHHFFAENRCLFVSWVDQLLKQTPSNIPKFTEKLLLCVSSNYAVPSEEQYLELLPRRSKYEYDIHLRTMFMQSPIFIDYLALLASTPGEFIKSFIICKNLLVNLIGDWNIITNVSRKKTDFTRITVTLLKAMATASWFPPNIQYCYEILPLIKSVDATALLVWLWKFLSKNAPPFPTRDRTSFFQEDPYTQKCIKEIQMILLRNMESISTFYPLFFSATQ